MIPTHLNTLFRLIFAVHWNEHYANETGISFHIKTVCPKCQKIVPVLTDGERITATYQSTHEPMNPHNTSEAWFWSFAVSVACLILAHYL